jgi:hypothetical protein
MRRLLPALLLLIAVVVLTGCESTFDKAAKLRAEQGTIADVEAVDVQQTEGITAETLAIIPSADGLMAAVVVQISSTGPGLLWAPIEVKLLDASGAEVGTNNVPGADPTLIHLPALAQGEQALYVNDQIAITGTPVEAKVTVAGEPVTAQLLPGLTVTKAVVTEDPSFGTTWTATITNDTGARQEQVIVQAILRDGETITSAGIAIVAGLDPGASADVQGFFIGTNTGELEVFAPAGNATDGAGAPSSEEAGDATVSMQ